jgi:hypothetical protein
MKSLLQVSHERHPENTFPNSIAKFLLGPQKKKRMKWVGVYGQKEPDADKPSELFPCVPRRSGLVCIRLDIFLARER